MEGSGAGNKPEGRKEHEDETIWGASVKPREPGVAEGYKISSDGWDVDNASRGHLKGGRKKSSRGV